MKKAKIFLKDNAINNKALISLMFIILILTEHSCTTKKKDLNDSKKVKNQGEIVHQIKFEKFDSKSMFGYSDLIDTIKYVALETSDECLFGAISELKIKNDRIYVLDRKNTMSVYVFDISGNYLYKLSNRGHGPSEYLEIAAFFINPDNSTEIYDHAKRKLFKYNSFGNFINEHTIGYHGMFGAKLAENCYFYYTHGSADNNKNDSVFDLQQTDSLGKVTKRFLNTNEKINRLKMLSVNSFYSNDNNTYFTRIFDKTIYLIKENEIVPFIDLDYGKYKLDYMKIRNREMTFNKPIITDISNLNITDKYIFLSFTYKYIGCNLIYNINLKDIISIGIGNYQKENTDGFDSTPKCVYKNQFVCVVQANNIIESNNGNNEFMKYSIVAKQLGKETIEKMNINSNPILMFIKLK